MKRLVRGLVPSAFALVGALAMVLVGQSGALAATTAGTTAGAQGAPSASVWGALQHQALNAVSGFRGDGALQSPTDVGPVMESTVTTPDGPVSAAQRSVVASGTTGSVVMSLTLLGGTQLVVDEVNSTSLSGATLVLAPGTSTIAGSYPIGRSAAAAAVHGKRARAETASIVRSTDGNSARLVTYAGCYAAPQYPGVIGSIFGPLVQGTGIIECAYAQTLSMIAALYKWYSSVGTASGSTSGYAYLLNVYYPCYATSGANQFITTELWAVDGVLQPGAESGASYLNCA